MKTWGEVVIQLHTLITLNYMEVRHQLLRGQLYPRGKGSQYLLNSRLCGSKCERCGNEKNFLHPPVIEHQYSGRPGRSLSNILTDITWLRNRLRTYLLMVPMMNACVLKLVTTAFQWSTEGGGLGC